MNPIIWFVLPLIVVFAVWVLWRILGVFFFTTYTKHVRIPIKETPADFGIAYREISFDSGDGLKLKGWLVWPPDYHRTPDGKLPAVIACHGYAANRSEIIDRTVAIARAGFAVFTFDWRACGGSEGDRCSGGLTEQADLRAAIEIVISFPEVDPKRIAIYGFSMGGAIAILVAAEDQRIKAVAADSPFVSMWEMTRHILRSMFMPTALFMEMADRSFRKHFGGSMRDVDVVSAVPKLAPRPLLILVGERDRVVPPWHSRKVFEAAGQPKSIEVNPNGGHFDNAEPQTFESVIIPFLKNAF